MRTLQFWILLLGSAFVSFLYITQIFLTRNLIEKQRELAENRETVTEGGQYEMVWKQLALHIYKVGSKDPELTDILKKEGIGIRPNGLKNAGSASAPPASAPPATTPPASAAPASSQTPAVPPHPNTP